MIKEIKKTKEFKNINGKEIMPKKILIIFALLSIVLISIIILINFKGSTGKAVLDITTDYLPNEKLKGNLMLSLKSGEFIPKDSIVSINLAENQYNYTLSDLVSESEKAQTGNFYIEGKNISGQGEGYGIGSETTSTNETNNKNEVSFTIKIISESSSESSTTEPSETNSLNKTEPSETTPTENTSTPTTETLTELPSIMPSESESPSTTPVTETAAPSENENKGQSENAQNEKSKGDKKSETTETIETTQESSSTTASEIPTETPATTPLTGQITSELKTEIQGTVSKDKPYVYDLKNKETAEITYSSHPVNLEISDDVATVTTDYAGEEAETETSQTSKSLEIDLSKLDLTAKDGNLKISIIYNNEELVSVSTDINANTLPETNITKENQTEKNITKITIKEDPAKYQLTEEELFLLKGKLGKTVADIVKAEEVNNRLIIKISLDKYWIEKSYDFSGGLNNEIKTQIELDKMKFTKKIAQEIVKSSQSSLSQTESNQQLQELLGNKTLIEIENFVANPEQSNNINNTLEITEPENLSIDINNTEIKNITESNISNN